VAQPKPVAQISPAKTVRLYRVQAGAFSSEEDAVRQGDRLKDKGYTTFVREGDDNLWRVQVGAFENRKGAELLVSDLKEKGFEAVIVTE
jgi:N-acetylmuramoyl-L-alanine amidase